jgi:hypothetical protein
MKKMNFNYYIVGSKYQDESGSWVDVFPDMLSKQVVSIGWADQSNLSSLYGEDLEEIEKYLREKDVDPKAIRPLTLFLGLKPGDLIAVKYSGYPVGQQQRLIIRAYAVVVERNGQVYLHDSHILGHLVNVEYLEANISLELPLNYVRTIHHLTNPDHIDQIFGPYYQGIESDGTRHRNINNQHRSGSSAYVAEAGHNILQQSVYEYLCKHYGKNLVKMETNGVDIILNKKSEITYFEVKPYHTAKQCIREALGQIVEYSWYVPTQADNLKLTIVGPEKPNNEEIEYIRYVETNFRQSLKYLCFVGGKLNGSE